MAIPEKVTTIFNAGNAVYGSNGHNSARIQMNDTQVSKKPYEVTTWGHAYRTSYHGSFQAAYRQAVKYILNGNNEVITISWKSVAHDESCICEDCVSTGEENFGTW